MLRIMIFIAPLRVVKDGEKTHDGAIRTSAIRKQQCVAFHAAPMGRPVDGIEVQRKLSGHRFPMLRPIHAHAFNPKPTFSRK